MAVPLARVPAHPNGLADTQPARSVKRLIGYWLGVLADIETDTNAVLKILANCR